MTSFRLDPPIDTLRNSSRYDHVALCFLLAADLSGAILLIQQLVQLYQSGSREWRRVILSSPKEWHPISMNPDAVLQALRLLKQRKLLQHTNTQWYHGDVEDYLTDASSDTCPLDPFRVQVFRAFDAMDAEQVDAILSEMKGDPSQPIEVNILLWILNERTEDLIKLLPKTNLQ